MLMTLQQQILEVIRSRPGTSKHELACTFQLSRYRLNRILRQVEKGLSGQTLCHCEEHGLWIVELQDEKCKGTIWLGVEHGGYGQCPMEPRFGDGRCYDHSQWENPEMVAFERELGFLVGPCRPTAYHVSQLNKSVVDELTLRLRAIEPLTRKDSLEKARFLRILSGAQAFLMWKDQLRRRSRDDRLPPELLRRHQASSINLFEFSLKKHFLILEVPSDSTREEVLKAWRRLARRHHPDTPEGDDERMKAINLAKEKIFRLRRWR